MFKLFVIFWFYSDSVFNRFVIYVQWGFFVVVFVEFDVDYGVVIGVFEDYVDVDGCGEEVGYDG